MSAFQVILGDWLREITSDIERKEKTIQRHKKISTDHKSDTVKNRERCDVTLTYEQSIYQNISPQGTVGNIIQNDKSNKQDIMSYCLQSNLDMSGLLQQRIDVYFKPRPTNRDQTMYDNMISDFKNSFWSKKDFSKFLERLSKYDVEGYVNVDTANTKQLYQQQLEFLWNSLLPPTMQIDKINKKSRNNNNDSDDEHEDEDLWEIIDLLHDNRLKEKLQDVIPLNLQTEIDQLIHNRVSRFSGTFDSEIFSELHTEYPLLNIDQESNSNKCLMVILFNIRKTLNLSQSVQSSQSDIRKLKIPVGINRTNVPIEYKLLTRPERAKVCFRKAKQLYTSGLQLILSGLTKNNPSDVARGTGNIYNIHDREYEQRFLKKNKKDRKTDLTLEQSCPLFKFGKKNRGSDEADESEIQEFLCDEFRDKISAASAVLLGYMELMDCTVSPLAPLMCRKDMCVTALYVEPNTKEISNFRDVENYNKWPDHKKKLFRIHYNEFLIRYKNVGFTATGSKNVYTNMEILNLLDWGQGDVIVNPFRVHEDTLLHKLFGALRFEFNRFGIGNEARQIWALHSIKMDYDRNYCKEFIKYNKEYSLNTEWFPRPVFDNNFYEQKSLQNTKEDQYGHLYFNVSSTQAQSATARRVYFNKLDAKKWFNLPFDKILDPEQAPQLYPVLSDQQPIKIYPTGQALLNVHENFRNSKHPLQMPFNTNLDTAKITLGVEAKPNWFLFRPIEEFGKQGIEPNQKAWNYLQENKIEFNALTDYETPFLEPTQISRLNCEPPPPLFNRFYHPLEHEIVETIDLLILKSNCEDYILGEPLNKNNLKCFNLPEWVNTNFEEYPQSQYFPYPLESLNGNLSATVFPIGWSKTRQPPYELTASQLYTMIPNQALGYWDLRNSLTKLLTNTSNIKFTELDNLLKSKKHLNEDLLSQHQWGYQATEEIDIPKHLLQKKSSTKIKYVRPINFANYKTGSRGFSIEESEFYVINGRYKTITLDEKQSKKNKNLHNLQ